jgi:purine nucleoside permease
MARWTRSPLASSALPSSIPRLATRVEGMMVGAEEQKPIQVKVVVVTMFEIGEDTGDRPAEFQTWVEQLPLTEKIPFPQGYRDLRYNPDKRVLGIVTGVGTARAAPSIMALGTDPRFDLTKAYWLIAGIAGVNPNEASIGSAAWAEWVVDGDLGFELDAREIPTGWPTGFIPLGKATPYEEPATDIGGAVYHLDPGLVAWAYSLTKTVKLEDTEALQQVRALYPGYPAAQMPPTVLRGDDVCGSTRHSGPFFNKHLSAWTAYWTAGKGRFVMTAMEDTGTAQSLTFLAKAGRVDVRRLIVLRTGSNYQMPYPGRSAADHIASLRRDGFPALIPALAAAYRVGSVVVEEIVAQWDKYADTIPTSA